MFPRPGPYANGSEAPMQPLFACVLIGLFPAALPAKGGKAGP
jgi:hypothetical protein